jgi:hypothetical protein
MDEEPFPFLFGAGVLPHAVKFVAHRADIEKDCSALARR